MTSILVVHLFSDIVSFELIYLLKFKKCWLQTKAKTRDIVHGQSTSFYVQGYIGLTPDPATKPNQQTTPSPHMHIKS